MKYSNEIIVQVPLDEFVKKMDNADNLKHWMEGLVSYEQIEGNLGEEGAKMRFNFDFKNRKMALIETITHTNFPHEFHAIYDAKGMQNIQQNFFEETSEGFTKWTSHAKFIPGNFMMKLMTIVMKGSFKKQSRKYLNDFKNFAENGVSVSKS